MEISSRYNPSEIEGKWYEHWMEKKYFHSTPDEREPYTIVIPPPNVTGVLHMGHMMNNTIQDILIRRARMQGKNACWVPGTDHASIATEAKVVNKLAQQGIKKTDLSRDEFLKHAWDWTHEHGGIILKQLRKLGCSCDWERTSFTMDEIRSKSVIRVFCDLYNKGLIYRGVRMVNWDPKALTALSDEEVVFKEEHSKLYYLRYYVYDDDLKGANGDENEVIHTDSQGRRYAVVATTRPETIMGDTAMCINPNDKKNQWLRGKKVVVPLVGRVVPVIEDEYVDIEFGTGCLKVTPAHDVNDYMLGEKHNLQSINIFNDDATISEAAGMYVGMTREDVRKQIIIDLQAANLLEKVEDYNNKVGYSERTNVPIEPKLSMQWFLKMEHLAKIALEPVEKGEIKFFPPKYVNLYRHWLENIKDWCISRQLWWGHQIPAYYLPEGGFVVAENTEEALRLAKEKTKNDNLTINDLRQDSDCLDTWFSSWLWPMSLFNGILEPDNAEFKYYYPTNDLITAPDIIFFWVARMIMAGEEYKGQMPFRNVYFTGIVRDKLGRKMSKSLGNSPDPIELIEKYGADGVRMGMLLTAPAGNDLPFDDALCEQGRNFCNKIWNALRLVKGWNVDDKQPQPNAAKAAVKWFDERFNQVLTETNDNIDKYRLSDALMSIYKLIWDDFCSWYLEMVKTPMGQSTDKATFDATITFFENLMKLLHPFMPFITEEIWHFINERKDGDDIIIAQQNKAKNVDRHILDSFAFTQDVINSIRKTRAEKNISNKEAVTLVVVDKDGSVSREFDDVIKKLCNVSEISYVNESPKNAFGFLVRTTEFFIPMSEKVDKTAERKKLEDELNYARNFLKGVEAKLSNDKFVNGAPAAIVEKERKKKADAEAKIVVLEAQLKSLE
ncbi:MAG: valine--tRNA ligase [Bacteroidales bacterium]|nr:valine--tRNA ligase [Bacteroidales bacterium]